ncbi:phosphoglycolate phosphatase [Silvimonas sp. JCM 19000]
MSIKAYAFDLDGTLVDSITDLARAANAARADLGLAALAEDVVESFVGDGAASLVARTVANDINAEFSGSAQQQAGLQAFNRHYLAGLSIATRFYPEVQATLATLHERGYPLAIVTNKPERFTLPLLRELGVREHFDLVISGDTLAERKPSPLPLLHVAEQFGVNPGELLMVGDSINDALAAQAAGCPVVVVSYGYGSDVEQFNADHIVQRFSELLEFVDA